MTRLEALALVALLLAVGCGADLGALGGLELHSHHFVASGRLAAATKIGTPLNDEGPLIGMALESRAEAALGSRWESGLLFGYGAGPAAIGGRVGWELYGEFGSPLHSTLFARGDFYTGLGFALPLHFGTLRHVVDLNQSTWILTKRLEFVPQLRWRLNCNHRPGRDALWRSDIGLGVSLRFRAFSDLF